MITLENILSNPSDCFYKEQLRLHIEDLLKSPTLKLIQELFPESFDKTLSAIRIEDTLLYIYHLVSENVSGADLEELASTEIGQSRIIRRYNSQLIDKNKGSSSFAKGRGQGKWQEIQKILRIKKNKDVFDDYSITEDDSKKIENRESEYRQLSKQRGVVVNSDYFLKVVGDLLCVLDEIQKRSEKSKISEEQLELTERLKKTKRYALISEIINWRISIDDLEICNSLGIKFNQNSVYYSPKAIKELIDRSLP
jgi:hypothetical protein